MEFWASAEIDQPAFSAMNKVRLCVEPFLNAAFVNSSLSFLPIKLRYVPIIMPDGTRERYPARSKLRGKEKLYDCAPQLDYDVFVEGSFADQVQEYLRGIALSAPHLAGLGASPRQIEEFEEILKMAAVRISQTGGTKH